MSPAPQITALKSIIVDAGGPELTEEERRLFKAEKPAGFILFRRNCVSREQVAGLVASMRECVGREDLPILIDQEGGSVARLKEPAFREYPPARHFCDMLKEASGVEHDPEGERRAVWELTRVNSCQMARDLAAMGITVNCAPVLDVPAPDCHEFLSATRVYGDTPEDVAFLGEAVCRGLLGAGVTPVIKHLPGHGRAREDSHFALPVTDAPLEELARTDFKPFRDLAASDMKKSVWGMVAHVVYFAVDPDSAASVSRKVTEKVIRGDIGFDGLLVADDVSMKALGGDIEGRVRATMAAGMDLTMLCNASFADRAAALGAAPRISEQTALRLQEAEARRLAWTRGRSEDDRTGTNA